MSRRILLAVVVLLCLGRVTAQEGRLERVREQVAAPDEPGKDHPAGRCADEDDWGLGELLAPFFRATVAAPFVGPAIALDDDWSHRLYFPPHPYPGRYPGYLLLPSNEAAAFDETLSEGVPRKAWGGRIAVEGGSDFSGLDRIGGQVRLDTAYRVGLLANWNHYHECRPDGRHDQLTLGDANVTLRFAQNEVASFYTGLGVRTLNDRCRTDYGFNFTYGGDWFPVRPLVVSGAVDLGTLGNAGVVHGRFSVGAVFRGWEVYTGYDFLRVGDVNLQGPMAGVRFWF